jgi:CDGSH-type Zn-finger protein
VADAAGDERHKAQLVPCPNGPILVRGDFEIVGSAGTSVDRGRRTIALCRCGLSSVKPFCDGSHKITGFRTEPELP